MKSAEEIRRVLVDELGFADLAAYRAFIERDRPHVKLTRERIERLSPDVVDNRAFWRVCEELFGADPVCNLAVEPTVGALPYAIEGPMDANRMNLRLARALGVLGFLEENAEARIRTLEIGAGFGSLKNWIETHTNHRYVGFDVFPRVPGVLETTADGLFPRAFVEGEAATFGYVVSTNVFQHLSARQRDAYIDDATKLVHRGGLFIVNIRVDNSKVPGFMRDESGRAWIDHYGQYTPLPKGNELYDALAARFDVLYMTQRFDGLFNFVCRRA